MSWPPRETKVERVQRQVRPIAAVQAARQADYDGDLTKAGKLAGRQDAREGTLGSSS